MSVTAPSLNASMLPKELKSPMEHILRGQTQMNQAVASVLNSALVVGQNLLEWTPYTAAAPLVVPSDWHGLSYVNSWVEYDNTTTGQYRKDFTGRVEIQARVKNGSAANAIVATLPAGFRPQQTLLFATRGSGAYASCQIDANGDIHFPDGGSTVDTSISFTFSASGSTPYVPTCFPLKDLLWPFTSSPTIVLAECSDATNPASPSNLVQAVPDWTLVNKGGSNFIRIRNIPGLVPSLSYAVSVVAF